MNDDTISRAAAINAICEDGTQLERQGQYSMTMAERKQRDADILDALPSAQQWIPCKERLPEKDGEYLTTTEDGLCDVWHYYDGGWDYDDVVAWCPLPAPWKGEQNG